RAFPVGLAISTLTNRGRFVNPSLEMRCFAATSTATTWRAHSVDEPPTASVGADCVGHLQSNAIFTLPQTSGTRFVPKPESFAEALSSKRGTGVPWPPPAVESLKVGADALIVRCKS